MTAQQSPVKQAVDCLVQTKETVHQLLSGEEHHILQLTMTSRLQQMINQLSFIAGVAMPTAVKEEYPPVTEFLGEKFQPLKEITKEDLTPEEEQRNLFIAKVDKLQAQFSTLAYESILNSYTLPEDVFVVRAVAKRAGLQDFETATINLHFLERIEKALKLKDAKELEQKKIDADLAKQQEITDLKERLRLAYDRKGQLPAELEEVQQELAAAKNDKDKKKAQAAVDAITADITAADELIVTLLNQYKELAGEDYSQ